MNEWMLQNLPVYKKLAKHQNYQFFRYKNFDTIQFPSFKSKSALLPLQPLIPISNRKLMKYILFLFGIIHNQ